LNSARRRTCSAGQVYVCILLLFPCNGLMLSTTPSVFQANDLIQKAIRVQDRLCIKYLDYTIITSSFFISELPAPPTASILPYGMYPSLTALPSSTLYPLRPYQSPTPHSAGTSRSSQIPTQPRPSFGTRTSRSTRTTSTHECRHCHSLPRGDIGSRTRRRGCSDTSGHF
jgi:hypothetical protein